MREGRRREEKSTPPPLQLPTLYASTSQISSGCVHAALLCGGRKGGLQEEGLGGGRGTGISSLRGLPDREGRHAACLPVCLASMVLHCHCMLPAAHAFLHAFFFFPWEDRPHLSLPGLTQTQLQQQPPSSHWGGRKGGTSSLSHATLPVLTACTCLPHATWEVVGEVVVPATTSCLCYSLPATACTTCTPASGAGDPAFHTCLSLPLLSSAPPCHACTCCMVLPAACTACTAPLCTLHCTLHMTPCLLFLSLLPPLSLYLSLSI